MTASSEPGQPSLTHLRRGSLPAPLESALTEGLIRSAAWWHGVRTVFTAQTRSQVSDTVRAELRRSRRQREELVQAALVQHRDLQRSRRLGVVDPAEEDR